MTEGSPALRALPAVHVVLGWPRMQTLAARVGDRAVRRAAREAIGEARRAILEGQTGDATTVDEARVEALLGAEASTLVPVINGTGVLLHTNLGRAPLAPEAIAAMARVSGGYTNLEYDLESGERGDRHGHAAPLLRALTGAEDALVVNNAAAAMLLALAAFATDREVVVSRGELIEIGGGFRIPDVLRQSGATLREIGTTNKTRRADYEEAIGDRTALLLKVHRASFAVIGFTEEVGLEELAALGRARTVPTLYDLGEGSLGGFADPPGETVASALAAGIDVVVFSADKLLGGPQGGVLAGRADLIARARKHPLLRALRPDKATLAALIATLVLHRDRPGAVPLIAMANTAVAALTLRATNLTNGLGAEASFGPSEAKLGGGSSPLHVIPSVALRLRVPSPERLAARLRETSPPVITRVSDGAVSVDLRAIPAERDGELRALLGAALTAHRAETATPAAP